MPTASTTASSTVRVSAHADSRAPRADHDAVAWAGAEAGADVEA